MFCSLLHQSLCYLQIAIIEFYVQHTLLSIIMLTITIIIQNYIYI